MPKSKAPPPPKSPPIPLTKPMKQLASLGAKPKGASRGKKG
jgi:hypothetical protein